FPGDAVTRLSTEGGTLALAGSDQLVTYTMMPGTDPGVWTIQADVHDFYMPSVQLAAVPMAFDLSSIELPDFALPAELDQLTNLQDGTAELADGAEELAVGLDALAAGSPQLNDGFAQLQATARELDTASTAIDEGIA